VHRWLSQGELIDDIHLWNDHMAIGQFDSGQPYVIAHESVIDQLRSSFESVSVGDPAPELLAPNGWG
jgi:hypothetical protein